MRKFKKSKKFTLEDLCSFLKKAAQAEWIDPDEISVRALESWCAENQKDKRFPRMSLLSFLSRATKIPISDFIKDLESHKGKGEKKCVNVK